MTTEVEQEKRCSKCFSEQSVNEFYPSKYTKDGRQGKCKACEAKYRLVNQTAIKLRKAAYHVSNREKVLKRLEKYRSKNANRNREREKARYVQIKLDPEKYAKYRSVTRNATKASRLRNPTHVKANSKVRTAIRFGKIVRPTECSSCGCQCKPEAHHDSYEKSQWLIVRWLCKPCHCAHHRKYPDLPK
jgi:hypothetical protein